MNGMIQMLWRNKWNIKTGSIHLKKKSNKIITIAPSFIYCLGTDYIPMEVEGKELSRKILASTQLTLSFKCLHGFVQL